MVRPSGKLEVLHLSCLRGSFLKDQTRHVMNHCSCTDWIIAISAQDNLLFRGQLLKNGAFLSPKIQRSGACTNLGKKKIGDENHKTVFLKERPLVDHTVQQQLSTR